MFLSNFNVQEQRSTSAEHEEIAKKCIDQIFESHHGWGKWISCRFSSGSMEKKHFGKQCIYLPIGSMGLVYFTCIGSCFNGTSVNVGKYTSSMDPMGNIPLRLRITIVSFFWRGGDVFHMIYKCIFEMYTNLLTQTQTSIFVTVPKVPFSKFWLLLCFPRNW